MTTNPKARWAQRAWFVLIAIAVALELTTLLRGRSGETMSSYVRSKVQHPVMRGVLGGLIGWLLYHWTLAPTTQLGWLDGASVGVGAVIGFLAGQQRLN